MEIGPLLVGIATIVLVVAPFVYLHKAQKNKELRFLNAFLALAEKQSLKITQHELWNMIYAIGLDPQSKKIFYLKRSGEKDLTMLVDLAEIEKCRVVNRSRSMKTSHGSSKVIDRLDLGFVNRNHQKSEKYLEFFNGDESLSLRGELPLVEKWCGIINAHLKTGRKKELA
jgi:hypothetical protein